MLGIAWKDTYVKPQRAAQEAPTPPQPIPEFYARAVVLIDQEKGEVIYGKNALETIYPASTTKILTALLALENCSPDEIVTVGAEINMAGSASSRAGLKVGSRLTMRSLLYALLLPSGNDAAYVIAVHTARARSSNLEMPVREALQVFNEMMNRRAREIGARNSRFINPDGYHNIDHYSTPYDMALIARESMKNSLFRQIVGTSKYVANDTSNNKLIMKNTNELLSPESPNYLSVATGIKTGRTTPAGACLVSSASYQNTKLIAVIMHSNERNLYSDSKNLLEFGARSQLTNSQSRSL